MQAGTFPAGVMESATPRWLPRSLVAALAVAGGSLLIAGSLMPWLSLYAGIDTISGSDGTNGRVLAAAGVLSVLAGVVYAWRPSKQLQYGVAFVGFAASGFAAWVLSQLVGTFQQLQGDAFVVASLGMGAFVALGGAVLVLGTIAVPQTAPADARALKQTAATSKQRDARSIMVTGASAFLVSAALIHLSVVGPHLQELTLYAVFFVCAAIAQLIAAVTLTMSRQSRWLVMIVIGNAAIIVVWALSRTVGLPIGPTPGIAESVSVPDVLASLAEGAIVVFSVALLLIRRPLMLNRWGVGSAAVAVAIAAMVMTVMAIMGVQAGGG